MCGRYMIDTEEEIFEIREIIREVNEKFANTPELAQMKTGEIFPTNIAPILTMDGSKRQARLMKWGFPRFRGSGVVFNAREETAAQKPMFRSSLQHRRCVVPSTGFFEWTHGADKKDKYMFNLPNSPVLYMAGIYNTFLDSQKNPYLAYTILTEDSNESVTPIHNRMPVILHEAELDAWLMDNSASQAFMNRIGPELALKKIV